MSAGFSRQRQRLVNWMRRQLIGPAGSGPLLGSPTERYPIGVLHPIQPDGWGVTGLDPAWSEDSTDTAGESLRSSSELPAPSGLEAPTVLSDDEEDDSSAGADGEPGDVMARPMARRRYVPPSSVGLSFFVRDVGRLHVAATAAAYRRELERDESGRFTAHRVAAGEPDVDGRESDGGSVGDGARHERTCVKCRLTWADGEMVEGGDRPAVRRRYRDGDVLTVLFSGPPAEGPGTPDTDMWEAQIDVRRRPYGDGHILTVAFANRHAERRLFEARVKCEIEGGELAEYPRVDPALLSDEEREIELRYRDTHIYAIGHGAAADWALEEGRPPRIWSECMPAVEVPAVTTEIAGLDVDVLVMCDLAEARFETTLDRLDAFVDGYDDWVGEQRAAARRLVRGDEVAAVRICERMEKAMERMRGGVERLRRDPDAALAFRLANRAMLDQMRRHDPARHPGTDARRYRWRPFQLAFLLAVLTSTIDEQDPCRDVLDLVWFPTGGGKTEAYLALFAFLVVWRRLRHGEAGGGTVALMRYTLRLLTRQQFERATRMVCALELLRRRGLAPIGDEPVSIGLWVGAAVSPNTFEGAAQQVAGLVTVDAAPAAGEAEAVEHGRGHGSDGNHGHHLVLRSCPWCGEPLDYRAGPTGFRFSCGNGKCEFGDGRPLPCNVVDEALYKEPPTLLVATIDKFARLAWEERAAAFFGAGRRRPPELVIQDELHLIAGPLGSVAGLYEAAIETVIEQRGVRPKYIASTATIRMADEQVRSLYGRRTAIFPPPGLSADDSWFARADRTRPGRLYVGYLASGLDQQHCLAPLAATLLAAPLAVLADQQEGDALLDAWWTQVVYHGSLRGVGASHNAFVTDVREFMRRLDAERRQAARESQPPEASDARRHRPIQVRGPVEPAQLTSQSSAQENARTFGRLALSRGAPDCLDAVLATNMISVGVDVDRLAAMIINGQPLTTAEYIQASSRIGRAEVPGLVFANYYRHQARSLSHYENFRPYHESFYRFVEPTSVTPYTYQVRKRALHAALVIALRHGCDAWTANAAAGRFDKRDAHVRRVVDALKRRCWRADRAASADTARHLDRLVDEWHDEAARCGRENRGLQYDCRDNAADRLLGAFEDKRPARWKTLNSMRNIEDTAVLRAPKKSEVRR